jgi:uncharacterized membrane protein YGL010W
MKKISYYLGEYAVSHQNPTNKIIHIICVPLIVMSVIGLLMCLGSFSIMGVSIDWALLVIILALIYYARLSLKYFALMLAFLLILYIINILISVDYNLLVFSSSLFILSWIAQFIGHKIEGKKPSFFQDLLFLLIGPLWVFKFIFRLKD